MEEKRTVKDIIQEAIQVLENLMLPVALTEKVGIPVAVVAGNLRACLRAFEEERKKDAAAEEGKE